MTASPPKNDAYPIRKTEAEWRAQLDPMQYRVAREAAAAQVDRAHHARQGPRDGTGDDHRHRDAGREGQDEGDPEDGDPEGAQALENLASLRSSSEAPDPASFRPRDLRELLHLEGLIDVIIRNSPSFGMVGTLIGPMQVAGRLAEMAFGQRATASRVGIIAMGLLPASQRASRSLRLTVWTIVVAGAAAVARRGDPPARTCRKVFDHFLATFAYTD